MKTIMNLKTSHRDNERNVALDLYSNGEQYLHYKIFRPLYLIRMMIGIWMAIYVFGIVYGVEGEQIQLKDEAFTCKEVFSTSSFTIMFYSFGFICDVFTTLAIMEVYTIQLSNV